MWILAECPSSVSNAAAPGTARFFSADSKAAFSMSESVSNSLRR
jgi:hypothetical protein